MISFRERARRAREQAAALAQNLGSIGDLKQGFDRGFAPASEDARSVLYKYRESLGLDEPPQAAEVASRSGLLAALRDGLTAQGAPDPIGFNDGMLQARLEAGQNIIDDPMLFQREIDKRLLSKRQQKLDKERRGGRTLADIDTSSDFSFSSKERTVDDISLTKDEERAVIRTAVEGAAEEVKRRMREQSILKKAGYNIGAAVGDINEDRSRSLYWLLNAPQAVTSTTADLLMSEVSPNLRSMRSISRQDLKRATDAGLLRKVGNEPLTDQQLSTLSARDEGYQTLDPAASEWLNIDNFEPAQPGIRRKYDPNIENILRFKREGEQVIPSMGDSVFGQRRVSPSTLAALGLGGTALATNAGLGLLGTEDTGIPFVGRREGYAAASPQEIDPRQSNNAALEIGTRYVLSRDGRLLPKADFALERPDVSAQDYANYQAYMYDKELDANPFDGNFNLGIVKGTTDGIHGAEVNILGQTLSANEAGIPLLGALGGLAAGAVLPNLRQVRLKNQRSSWTPGKGKRGAIKNILGYLPEVRGKTYNRELDTNPKNPLLKNPTIDKVTQSIEDYFLEQNPVTGKTDMNSGKVVGALGAGTFGGVALGTLIGLEAEDRRRRENFAEDRPGVDYDIYKRNAKALLDQKYQMMEADPKATEKLEKSKAGFSRVSQQESLMNVMQDQQAVIDTVADAYFRGQMQDAMGKQEWAAGRIEEIEKERERRRSKQQDE